VHVEFAQVDAVFATPTLLLAFDFDVHYFALGTISATLPIATNMRKSLFVLRLGFKPTSRGQDKHVHSFVRQTVEFGGVRLTTHFIILTVGADRSGEEVKDKRDCGKRLKTGDARYGSRFETLYTQFFSFQTYFCDFFDMSRKTLRYLAKRVTSRQISSLRRSQQRVTKTWSKKNSSLSTRLKGT
jgi:hypothetical protein